MAKEWYEKTKDYTDRDMQFMLIAYRNSLCNTEDGRQVLTHIKTLLDSFFDDPQKTAVERVAARNIFDLILFGCGIVGNLKIIKALSGVAAAFSVPKKEETDNLNV